MKRPMAILVVLLMVLSIVPLAFADNHTIDGDDNSTDAGDSGDNATDDGTGDDDAGDDAGDGNETVEDDGEGDDNETIEDDGDGNETVEDDGEDDGNETIVDDGEGDDNETIEDGDNETGEDSEEDEEELADEAGITPDSFVWGLERAMERLDLLLTFNKAAKAKKGLAHARERLAEVQAMIAAKRLDKAAKAQEAHDDILEEVSENIEELGNGDAEEELGEELELEEALEEHRALIVRVGKSKLKTKGLTAEQQEAAASLFESLTASADRVKVDIKAKKDRTKIKIKAQSQLTDEEVDALEADIRSQFGDDAKVRIKVKRKGKSGDTQEVEVEDDDETDDDEEGDDEEDDADDADDEDDDDDDGSGRGRGRGRGRG